MNKFPILFSLIFFVALNVIGQIPTSNLIGYWSFNGNANDESFNSNHGTVYDATLIPDRFGILNRAYSFDGNDGISIPHSLTLNMSDSLSFSVWVKPESLTGTKMILGKSNFSSTTNYLIRIMPGGYIQWEYNGYTETDSVPLHINTWHHIVVSAEGPGQTKKIYLDNRLIAVTAVSSGPSGFISDPFTIGYASYNSEFFVGAIDDIRMYRKELTVVEINALFNETCSTSDSIDIIACNSYKAPDGFVYSTSGIKNAVIPNSAGCDSVITINLIINSIDIGVSQNADILTANATAATYQWMECGDTFSLLQGETKQTYTASVSGNVAVEVTQNGCVDTSLCYPVVNVGIIESTFENEISVYPNPTNGLVKIDLGVNSDDVIAMINDSNGLLVKQMFYKSIKTFDVYVSEPSGVYILTIIADIKSTTIRLIKR